MYNAILSPDIYEIDNYYVLLKQNSDISYNIELYCPKTQGLISHEIHTHSQARIDTLIDGNKITVLGIHNENDKVLINRNDFQIDTKKIQLTETRANTTYIPHHKISEILSDRCKEYKATGLSAGDISEILIGIEAKKCRDSKKGKSPRILLATYNGNGTDLERITLRRDCTKDNLYARTRVTKFAQFSNITIVLENINGLLRRETKIDLCYANMKTKCAVGTTKTFIKYLSKKRFTKTLSEIVASSGYEHTSIVLIRQEPLLLALVGAKGSKLHVKAIEVQDIPSSGTLDTQSIGKIREKGIKVHDSYSTTTSTAIQGIYSIYNNKQKLKHVVIKTANSIDVYDLKLEEDKLIVTKNNTCPGLAALFSNRSHPTVLPTSELTHITSITPYSSIDTTLSQITSSRNNAIRSALTSSHYSNINTDAIHISSSRSNVISSTLTSFPHSNTSQHKYIPIRTSTNTSETNILPLIVGISISAIVIIVCLITYICRIHNRRKQSNYGRVEVFLSSFDSIGSRTTEYGTLPIDDNSVDSDTEMMAYKDSDNEVSSTLDAVSIQPIDLSTRRARRCK